METTGWTRRAPSPTQRIGWLLRANRLHGNVTRYRKLGEFAADIALDSNMRPPSISAISRWENGESVPPYAAVRRYEQLLTLPDGAISGVGDTVIRYFTPPLKTLPQWPRDRRPPPGKTLDDLLDRACNGGTMSCQDWNRLTDFISRHNSILFNPKSAWQKILARLLNETIVSDGPHWMTRAEAYHRLMSHPATQEIAVSVAAAAAADRNGQSMIGDLAFFSACDSPSSNRVVVQHILNPFTEQTLYGSLLTSFKKIRFGSFSEVDQRLLIPVLNDLTKFGGDSDQTILSAQLLSALPDNLRKALSRNTWDRIKDILQPAPMRLTERIYTNTQRELANSGRVIEDQNLRFFIHEMLSAPVFDVRLCTMFLLYSTPYRAALGAALQAELDTARRIRSSQVWVSRLLESLRVIGDQPQRRTIEQLLITQSGNDRTLESAAYALAHVGGTTSQLRWRQLISIYTERWQRHRRSIDTSILDHLVYAAGISGQLEELQTLPTSRELPTAVQASANWWCTIPQYIRESAAR